MKMITLTAALLLTAAPVAAAPERDDICQSVGELAQTLMAARQSGVPMSKVMAVAKGDDEKAASLLRELVLLAYEKPRFSTAAYRTRAAVDFRDEVELSCWKAQKK